MEDGKKNAFSTALKVLAVRDRSEKELRAKLSLKGFTEEDIEGTVVKLRDRGFLNDGRLAGLLVEDAVKNRHFGAHGVKAYLKRRGIPGELVEQTLKEPVDEAASAEALIRKRMKSMQGLDLVTVKRRLWGLLLRRGFSAETIIRVLKNIPD